MPKPDSHRSTRKQKYGYAETKDEGQMHEMSKKGWELMAVVVSHYDNHIGQLTASEFIYYMRWEM